MKSRKLARPDLIRLEDRLLLSGDVVISEFMADNDSTLTSADGNSYDWIELYNTTGGDIDLTGWYLTDDPELSELWQIPAVTIDSGDFIVIFASDEDSPAGSGELHADFKLSKDGEYLALIRPDGQTIEYQYAPEYPEQLEDISYGIAFDSTSTESIELIAEADAARVIVPTQSNWDTNWKTAGFDDSSWTAATSSVGYEANTTSSILYDDYFQTDLQSEMYAASSSVLIRIPFTVEDPSDLVAMTLSMRYDDGFMAFINGVYVASSNSPASLSWDSTASDSRSDEAAIVFSDFDVSNAISSLVTGENILAIHALNHSDTSSDFLNVTKLSADQAGEISDSLEYFTTPTPGQPNEPGTLGKVKDTKFSVDRGFYDSAFLLEISCDTDGAQIRYTLDGSTPTATHGNIYSGPIEIFGQTVIRAAAFKAGYLSSGVDAQTYIFIDDVLTQVDNPEGYPDIWNGDSHTRPGDYGMDPEVTDDPAYSDLFEDAFKAIPTISITTDIGNLFDPDTGIYIKATREGMDYERPCTVEYFTADGSDEFTINCGIRMRGGASRSQRTTPKHSFRLIFRDMYGAGKLNYPLFGADATDSFDTIILRAGSNLSWPHHNGWPVYTENRQYAQYVRDQWAKEIQADMGNVACHNNYAHLYINGIYWGLYNPGERPSAPFAADYMGGDKEDYDVINSGEAIDGDLTAWNELMDLADTDLSNAGNYQEISDMLDLESFSDYMIINQFGGNIDWDHHNWQAFRNREAEGKWYFVMWDTEIIFVNLTENRIDPSKFGALEPSSSYEEDENILTHMWLSLLENDEYKMMFADRLHNYLFNDGILTPDAIVESWTEISDVVYDVIICESARWGDYRRDVYYAGNESRFDDRQLYDRDEEWVAERDRLINNYFPYRTQVVIDQYKAFGVYPTVVAPSFSINGTYQHGGEVATGSTLSIDAPNGTIFFTTNGEDPRMAGGSISTSAQIYTGQNILISDNTNVKARVYNNGKWSALNQADYIADNVGELLITEINYNPPAPTDDEIQAGFDDDDMFEFIELHNPTGSAISLTGISLTGGISFDFDSSATITSIPAGGYVVVVADTAAFTARYGAGIAIAGVFDGKLSNSGETITLQYGEDSNVITSFTYEDSGSWPGRADGKGATLVLDDPAIDPNDSDAWRSSSEYLGSPGSANAAASSDIVINEVLSHTDLPQSDSIELYNTTGSAIDISGWVISDSSGNYSKFVIPAGTIIAAHGYVVFDEYDFNASGLDTNPDNDQPNDFGLDGAHGDEIWFMQADSSGNIIRFVDHVEFDAAANGESFSRWPNGSGDLLPAAPSLGAANNSPRVGPVIISEIMYNPTGLVGSATEQALDADFNTYDSRFSYVDDPFGTNFPEAASGSHETGYLNIKMDAINGFGETSGGWQVDFTSTADGLATIEFTFSGMFFSDYSLGDTASIFVAVDGQYIGDEAGGAAWLLDTSSTGSGLSFITVNETTLTLQANVTKGLHTLTIGARALFGSTGAVDMNIHQVEVTTPDKVDHAEYIEIQNTSAEAVDLTGWKLRGGVDFDFPAFTIIPAGGTLIVTDFNPELSDGDTFETNFRNLYGVSSSVEIIGGFFGKLDNSGETIKLLQPDEPPADEPDYTPMLLADKVKYDDSSPWPDLANGMGKSLRRVGSVYGTSAAAWVAAQPCPGGDGATISGDIDADGDVDIYDFLTLRSNYGTGGNSVNDGDIDADGDVDIFDFLLLRSNYGQSAQPVTAAVGQADDVLAEILPASSTENILPPEMIDREIIRPKPTIFIMPELFQQEI